MKPIETLMRQAPVIPVVVLHDVADAVPVAQALVAGGLPCIEVTLRTPAALDCIRAIRDVPGAIIGAGTVLNPRDLDAAMEAGAKFIVSPGLTESLGRDAVAANIPFLPGVANAGDIMRGMDLGLSHFKFFPAVTSGGLPALKALTGPFGEAKFCPTGGVTLASAPDWLALDAILCVGGTWLFAGGMKDVAAIEAAARSAAALGTGGTA